MRRAVLDTNVVVSALLVPNGTQAKVLLFALSGAVTLCLSPSILQEYEEVLRRPRFRLAPRRVEEATRFYPEGRAPGSSATYTFRRHR